MPTIALILALFFSLVLTPVSSIQGEPSPYVDTKRGEVTILEDRKYLEALLSRINSAGKDILMSMYIFKITGGRINSATRIKDAFIKAAQRGVKVRVLLEREDEEESTINLENEYTARKLVKGGVMVYFDSPQKRTHVKAVVIDGRYTFIGSHNLTSSALQHNRELSLMIESEDVARTTAGYIEEMMAKGQKQ